MSNNNDISVQGSNAKTYTLQHPDGSEVTAQEVYDAFMSGQIKLYYSAEGAYLAVNTFFWCDANISQDDPTNVVYAEVSFINAAGLSKSAEVGTYPS